MATGRREFTWQACDALAAAGRKPSIASVREWTLAHHGRKQGSDTDTQADINAWYGLLLALKQEKQTVAGLPDDIAALARGLWIRANEAANDALQAQRAGVDAELVTAGQQVVQAQAATATERSRAAVLGHERDIAHEAIRRLEDAMSEIRATVQATEVRHAGQLQLRDEQHAALGRELARKDADHAARLAELDGLRRHALVQIDEARLDARTWKNEHDRNVLAHQSALLQLRMANGKQQEELAGAAGRMSAIEEALTASRQQNALLEATLTETRASAGRNTTAQARRPGGMRLERESRFKRRRP
ncbi:MAG: DNA-binding protein [Herminiimonas sp.]|nr:DNA-binding protein [Herminiimonas sp.]